MLKLIFALCMHVKLALTLSHDGSGMPKQIPAALLLAIGYITVNLLNHYSPDGIPISTFIMLGFIAQSYVMFLRNELIGLIMLISIICNGFTLILTSVLGIPAEQLGLLVAAEYIFVTGAIVNVIKRVTTTI